MTELTQKKENTQIASWQQELENQAKIAAATEDSTGSGAGQFFSTKAGVLSWNDSPLEHNSMIVVIVDSVIEHTLYTERYNPDNLSSPVCFSFGRDLNDMKPHELSTTPQHPTCVGCPQNEWGSSDVGKGKACGNGRRLALLMAGSLNPNGDVVLEKDVNALETSDLGFLRLPVTSVKNYAQYVKKLAAGSKRPPHGVVTKISVVPDNNTIFKIIFQEVAHVGDEVMPLMMKRHAETQDMIAFPYQPMEPETETKKPTKRKY